MDDAIRALQRVAPFPDLYPSLIATDAVESLVGLLSHDNADVAGAVLEVLQELTDVGNEEEDEGDDEESVAALTASAASLARSFVAAGGGEAAAERLSSFDEAVPEEAGFLFAGLSALLNMAELDEGAARSFVGAAAASGGGGGSGGGDESEKRAAATVTTPTTTKLIPWLLRRISSPSPASADFSSIAQAASELVSTLAQAGAAGALSVVKGGGVDSLLRALAKYRKKAPAPGSGDELEHAANLFDALCALLLKPEGREAFVEAEGVELMLLLIRKHGTGSGGEKEKGGEKSDSATAKLAAASATALASQALRCLEFATTSGGGGGGGESSSASSTTATAAAKRFVEGGGLGPLFGGFMGRSRLGRGGKRRGDNAGKRACLGLVVNLLQCLDPFEGGGGGGGGGGGEKEKEEGEEGKAKEKIDPALFARVLSKFREAGFEKLDRLVDLAAEASASLVAHDARVAAREKLRAEEEGRKVGDDEEEDEDEDAAARKLVARLSAGGDDLQLCALVAAYCWSSFSDEGEENKVARAHFVRALHAKGMTLSGFRRSLEERRGALGSEGGGDDEHAEERRLTRLVAALGGGGKAGGGGGGGGGEDSEQRPEKRARN